MENQASINSEELSVQKLLSNYLKLNLAGVQSSAESIHLDEDLLSAFVEGSLGERESHPIISHLVDCSFCRNVTSELVKLDMALAEELPESAVVANAPSRISEVLNGILTRIFGSNEGAVFAHQEKEEESDESENDKET